jgi:hypothetical protein
VAVDNFRNSLELRGILVVVAVTTKAYPDVQNLDIRRLPITKSCLHRYPVSLSLTSLASYTQVDYT